jgi:hypothetical protein
MTQEQCEELIRACCRKRVGKAPSSASADRAQAAGRARRPPRRPLTTKTAATKTATKTAVTKTAATKTVAAKTTPRKAATRKAART